MITTVPSTVSMVPRMRDTCGCWALAGIATSTAQLIANAYSFAVMGMDDFQWEWRSVVGISGVGRRRTFNPSAGTIFRSQSECLAGRSPVEVSFDKRPQFRRDLRSLAEPKLKTAHSLVQQHAKPVRGSQSARPGRFEKRC